MRLPDFKCDIGDEIHDNRRDFIIIDKQYRKIKEHKKDVVYDSNKKYYKYRCLRCGNEDWIIEHSLFGKQQTSCNACCKSPKKLVVGVKDITTTASWMTKYFIGGESEASKYFKFSKVRIDMKCPDCGKIHKNKLIDTVCNNGNLTCECQDGWSYPNKFMYAFLSQINVDFTTEKKFEWSDNKIYDDYVLFDGYKIIIENHGLLHYKNKYNFGRGIENEHNNDEYKRDLAIRNGIDYYVSIDCSVSDMNYIKGSIMNSCLVDIFNIRENDINWSICNEFAHSNLLKSVCSYKNINQNKTIQEIADIFKISYCSALKYIKTGNCYGWCNYDAHTERVNAKSKSTYTSDKPIMCVDNSLYFRSAKFAKSYFNILNMDCKNIRFSCTNGIRHKGLLFNYISREKFNEVKQEYPDKTFGDLFVL